MGEAISLFFSVLFSYFQVYGIGGSYFIFYFRRCYWLGGGLFRFFSAGSSALKGMDGQSGYGMGYLRSARGPSDLGNGIIGMRTSIGMDLVLVHCIQGIWGKEIRSWGYRTMYALYCSLGCGQMNERLFYWRLGLSVWLRMVVVVVVMRCCWKSYRSLVDWLVVETRPLRSFQWRRHLPQAITH